MYETQMHLNCCELKGNCVKSNFLKYQAEQQGPIYGPVNYYDRAFSLKYSRQLLNIFTKKIYHISTLQCIKYVFGTRRLSMNKSASLERELQDLSDGKKVIFAECLEN